MEFGFLIKKNSVYSFNILDTMSSQRLVDGDNIPDEINDLHTLPPTYIVLHIRPKVHETTIKWLVEKIRGKRRDGGAELIIMRQPYKPDEVFLVVTKTFIIIYKLFL